MEQYIPKSALVAEIERRYETNLIGAHSAFKNGKIEALREIKDLLDTLEVKEVDLEKEIQDHIKECLDIKFPTTNIELIKKDVAYTARKFFELGMSISNKAQKGE